MNASRSGARAERARRSQGLLGLVLACACVLPLAAACSGTATIKTPVGGVDIAWDTTQLQELYGDLEEFIEINLEYLNSRNRIRNRAAVELAIENIEEATAAKDKLAALLDPEQPSIG